MEKRRGWHSRRFVFPREQRAMQGFYVAPRRTDTTHTVEREVYVPIEPRRTGGSERTDIRAYVYTAKSKPCSDCGTSYPPCVMEFDHVRGSKAGNIAVMMRVSSLGRIIQEIDKCELVCANCHRLRHLKRRQH